MARRMKRKNKTKRTKLSKGVRKTVNTMINRKLPHIETKEASYSQVLDVTYAPGAIDNTSGDLIPLVQGRTAGNVAFNIGSGNSQRIGTEVNIKRIRISWTSFAAAATNGSSYRVIVFKDTKFPTAGLANTNLFNDPDPMFNLPAAIGTTIHYAYNTDTVGKGKRYKIYRDFIVDNRVLGNNSAVIGPVVDNNFRTFIVDLKFKGKGPLQLMTPGGVTGQTLCQKTQYFIYFIASGNAGNNVCNEISWQVEYLDA